MKDLSIEVPILSAGKKFYPVTGWTNSRISTKQTIEYFETKEEAKAFIKEQNK